MTQSNVNCSNCKLFCIYGFVASVAIISNKYGMEKGKQIVICDNCLQNCR